MKVRARHNVNHNGVWHAAGEVFEIDDGDFDGVAEYVTAERAEKNAEFVSAVFPPDEPDDAPKRGRRKKTEE